jgi:hypothetical protein
MVAKNMKTAGCLGNPRRPLPDIQCKVSTAIVKSLASFQV